MDHFEQSTLSVSLRRHESVGLHEISKNMTCPTLSASPELF